LFCFRHLLICLMVGLEMYSTITSNFTSSRSAHCVTELRMGSLQREEWHNLVKASATPKILLLPVARPGRICCGNV
jgi:replicative DNA helicase